MAKIAASDGDLLELIRQGDRLAFAQLYSKYSLQAVLLASGRYRAGADTPDVVQDVWIEVAIRPPVLLAGNLVGWLDTAIRNRVHRVRSSRPQPATFRTSLVAGSRTTPTDGVARAELRKLVLDAHTRGDLTDIDVESLLGVGVSAKEIATRDGIRPGAARARASRAMSKLLTVARDFAGW